MTKEEKEHRNNKTKNNKMVDLNPTISIVSLIVYRLNRDSQNGEKETQLLEMQFKYKETKKQKRTCAVETKKQK